MTSKEFVKSKMPNARTERHFAGRIKGMQEVYWLIRDGNQTMYFASGKTESNAWVKAKKRILELDEKNKKDLESGRNTD